MHMCVCECAFHPPLPPAARIKDKVEASVRGPSRAEYESDPEDDARGAKYAPLLLFVCVRVHLERACM